MNVISLSYRNSMILICERFNTIN